MKVKLVWKTSATVGKKVHTAVVIIHGDTDYFYINVSRDEAQRRFDESMQSRTQVQAELEPTEAAAHIVPFDDEFVIWHNPGAALQKMSDMILSGRVPRGIAGDRS